MNPLLPNVGGRPRIYDDVQVLAAKETVSTWLRGLKEGPGRKTAGYHLARFIRWRLLKGLEADPDRIIEGCVNGTNKTLIENLKVVQDFCLASEDFKGDDKETRRRVYRSIRGFYLANFCALPQAKLRVGDSPAESPTGRVKSEMTAFEFLKAFRKVLDSVKLSVRDRALMVVQLQGAMDNSTLTEKWNHVAFPQLVDYFGTEDHEEWDSRECPVQIDLARPKSGDLGFYNFLDVDGIDCLKEWFGVRQRLLGKPVEIHRSQRPDLLPTSDPIFINQHLRPMKPANAWKIWCDAGKRAGLNFWDGGVERYKGASIRYGFHAHECRDVAISLAPSCGVDPMVANFIAGHTIDPLKYQKSPRNDPGYFRAEHAKLARPYLNPVSGKVLEAEETITKKFEDRLTNLKAEILAEISSKRRPRQ